MLRLVRGRAQCTTLDEDRTAVGDRGSAGRVGRRALERRRESSEFGRAPSVPSPRSSTLTANMPFGQVVIGPPGSGKSTYCFGLHQFYSALERPVLIVNLDPAAPSPSYPCAVNISSLISLADAMDAHSLGPNGAMLYCLEYLEANLDWLEGELDRALEAGGWGRETGKRDEAMVVFDTPGQVELSTDHGSLKRILERLGAKGGWRLAAVHLVDAHHITDASKYVALLLLSLRTMLQLELPHINVLSKIDLLGNAGELPFNLDFYTEVKDLDYLVPLLEADVRTRRFSSLNQTICELVEDFGLVSFETLAVEDKDSMLRLVRTIDQALGYVAPFSNKPVDAGDSREDDFFPAAGAHGHDHDHDHDHDGAEGGGAHRHHHQHSRPATRPADLSNLYHSATVQEKWVDHREAYEAFDRKKWEEEGDEVMEEANRRSRREAGETH